MHTLDQLTYKEKSSTDLVLSKIGTLKYDICAFKYGRRGQHQVCYVCSQVWGSLQHQVCYACSQV